MSDPGVDKDETMVKTIRIPASIGHSLKTRAEYDGMTINAEVNSIIRQDLDWHRKMEEYGFVLIPRQLFRAVIEKLDDDALALLGREVIPTLFKEMVEWWQQDSSPEGMLSYLKLRGRPYTNSTTTVTREGDRYTIVHRHDYGPKWSVIIQGAMQEFVRKSFQAEPQVSVGESVVVGRFKVDQQESFN